MGAIIGETIAVAINSYFGLTGGPTIPESIGEGMANVGKKITGK